MTSVMLSCCLMPSGRRRAGAATAREAASLKLSHVLKAVPTVVDSLLPESADATAIGVEMRHMQRVKNRPVVSTICESAGNKPRQPYTTRQVPPFEAPDRDGRTMRLAGSFNTRWACGESAAALYPVFYKGRVSCMFVLLILHLS